MTDQKNPPRTREEQIRQVARSLKSTTTDLSSYEIRQVVTAIVEEAEARGRAEALAELRAGAEPVGWCLITADGGILGLHEEKRIPESYPHRYATDALTPLYAHPPIPREAELAARVAELDAENLQLREFYEASKGVRSATDESTMRTASARLYAARAALVTAPETQG